MTKIRKSKLREQNDLQQDLGIQYAGSKISRDELEEGRDDDDPFGQESEQEDTGNEEFADPEDDLGGQEVNDDDEIDSDEAFESGDEQKFEGYSFRGSRKTRLEQEEVGFEDKVAEDLEREAEDQDKDPSVAGSDDVASNSDREEGGVSDYTDGDDEEVFAESDSDDTSISDESYESKADDRTALRKMMAEEQKRVAASLSKAAQADVEKGRAIKEQRTTFATLLNTRIKLQKALTATNSMTASSSTSSDHTETILAAETAALNLWNTISYLRSSLQTPRSKKRHFSATSSSTYSDLWDHMRSQENASISNRRANLTKWSQKTNPATALLRANRFSQTPTQQPLISVLDQQLSGANGEKLISKTKTPRSCAPIQAAARLTEDPTIYDDADFYTLLLRELVDQRMAEPSNPAPIANANTALLPLPSQRDLKVKKQVDTKASKGRKMRYAVHEKLQNFMAPDDKGSWGERQRSELFGGLLGRRIRLGEDDGDEEGDEEEMEGVKGGLRLF